MFLEAHDICTFTVLNVKMFFFYESLCNSLLFQPFQCDIKRGRNCERHTDGERQDVCQREPDLHVHRPQPRTYRGQ